MQLAEELRSFRYDPSLRFRGWLRRRFHWCAVDAIRERGREGPVVHSLDDPSLVDVEKSFLAFDPHGEEDDEPTLRGLRLLDLMEQVQATVREKVQAQTWQVFWRISIEGWTIRQTADSLNMTYLATHTAHKRVLDRLVEEGGRRLADQMSANTDARTSRS